MTKTTILWQRMMTAARTAAQRHGWRAAAKIRRNWAEWFYRRLHQQQPEHKDIDARLRAIFRPSQRFTNPFA